MKNQKTEYDAAMRDVMLLIDRLSVGGLQYIKGLLNVELREGEKDEWFRKNCLKSAETSTSVVKRGNVIQFPTMGRAVL